MKFLITLTLAFFSLNWELARSDGYEFPLAFEYEAFHAESGWTIVEAGTIDPIQLSSSDGSDLRVVHNKIVDFPVFRIIHEASGLSIARSRIGSSFRFSPLVGLRRPPEGGSLRVSVEAFLQSEDLTVDDIRTGLQDGIYFVRAPGNLLWPVRLVAKGPDLVFRLIDPDLGQEGDYGTLIARDEPDAEGREAGVFLYVGEPDGESLELKLGELSKYGEVGRLEVFRSSLDVKSGPAPGLHIPVPKNCAYALKAVVTLRMGPVRAYE